MRNLVVRKRVDASSVKLYLAAASGERIKDLTLDVCQVAAGKPPACNVNIILTDVVVKSVDLVGASDGTMTDLVSFSFAKIEWTYRPIKSDGSLGQPIRAGWDIPRNQSF